MGGAGGLSEGGHGGRGHRWDFTAACRRVCVLVWCIVRRAGSSRLPSAGLLLPVSGEVGGFVGNRMY